MDEVVFAILPYSVGFFVFSSMAFYWRDGMGGHLNVYPPRYLDIWGTCWLERDGWMI